MCQETAQGDPWAWCQRLLPEPPRQNSAHRSTTTPGRHARTCAVALWVDLWATPPPSPSIGYARHGAGRWCPGCSAPSSRGRIVRTGTDLTVLSLRHARHSAGRWGRAVQAPSAGAVLRVFEGQDRKGRFSSCVPNARGRGRAVREPSASAVSGVSDGRRRGGVAVRSTHNATAQVRGPLTSTTFYKIREPRIRPPAQSDFE